MIVEIDSHLYGLNEEFIITNDTRANKINGYNIRITEELDGYDNTIQSSQHFLSQKNVFPIYVHLKTYIKGLMCGQQKEYETVIYNNRKKEYYYKFCINNYSELTIIKDVFEEGIVNNPVLITIEECVFSKEGTKPSETSKYVLSFNSPTFYIWVGYDGMFWEYISNISEKIIEEQFKATQ